jgi:N6-L-threonylcarbamoyladenine synthase
MLVLGIETSCDETAAAVVKDGKEILSNIISSSLRFHKKYWGIVPEIAFRKQLETITGVVDCALKEASLSLKNINLVSVTEGPGLLGSLLVGISFAKAISIARDIPFLGINHLYSHIYASFLNRKISHFPFVALIVSGGHTSLYYVRDFSKITLLGSTQDDACGEAFDKVAKILKLGYPGGPIIEKLAKNGNPKKIRFGCSNTRNPLDFSFSGIKTAVLYYVQKHSLTQYLPVGRQAQMRSTEYGKNIADICASFQESVLNTLIDKSLFACKIKKTKNLVVGGGVAANNRLREKFAHKAEEKKINILFPAKEYCMDNAAMVAGLGYQLFRRGFKSNLSHSAVLEERS